MKQIIRGITLALVVSVCAFAADTINLAYDGALIGFGSATVNPGPNGGATSVSSGLFKVSGKVNGAGATQSYNVVCITPNVWLNLNNGNPHTIDYSPFDFSLTAAKQDLLSRLFGTYYNEAITSTEKSSAFQLVAWEIAFESNGSYGLGTGTFTASGTGSATAATWLSNLVAGNGTWAPIMAFVPDNNPLPTNGLYNSQILITMVPEPGFYGVLALGLSGLYMAFRRRNAA